MTPHPIHPWYGPCDALADGECAECRKEVERLRTALRTAREDALEEAAKVAQGWPCEAADNQYQTCGNGHYWDAGNVYDQGRIDAATAIRNLKEKT